MATTSPSLPMQQQPAGETLTYNPPVAVPNNNAAWSSSGSIGPFFAVMSVLTVLAILSCLLGRMCTKEAVTPLESIKDRDCLGWVKRKCRQCMSCDVKVGMKMMGFGKGRNDCNVKDGEVHQLPQP